VQSELWPGGPLFSDKDGDATCDLPAASPNDNSVWDFFFTDFAPDFWQQFPKDGYNENGEAWLSWHGTHIYGGLCGLASNYLARSESENGQLTDHDRAQGASPGNIAKRKMETAVMRGIYTSPEFTKAPYTLTSYLRTW